MPVSPSARPDREAHKIAWRKRLRVRRAILSVLIVLLSLWLANAALAPSSGPVERVLLLTIAYLLPMHLIFWQLEGIKLLERSRRWPKPVALAVLFLAFASSPMVLYPLGLVALLVSLFAGGGAAAPALAISGLLLLSPIILILLIALMFMVSGYKGG